MSEATLQQQIEHTAQLVVEYEKLGWDEDAERARRKLYELEQMQREAVSAAAQRQVDAFTKKNPTWWEWAMLQYRIDPIPSGFRVISQCLQWKEERSWDYYSIPECQLKIIQLVDWKDADRNRNRGDREEDLKKGRNT